MAFRPGWGVGRRRGARIREVPSDIPVPAPLPRLPSAARPAAAVSLDATDAEMPVATPQTPRRRCRGSSATWLSGRVSSLALSARWSQSSLLLRVYRLRRTDRPNGRCENHESDERCDSWKILGPARGDLVLDDPPGRRGRRFGTQLRHRVGGGELPQAAGGVGDHPLAACQAVLSRGEDVDVAELGEGGAVRHLDAVGVDQLEGPALPAAGAGGLALRPRHRPRDEGFDPGEVAVADVLEVGVEGAP